jgi:prepilin-type N-terminal cleavage/methylation domain-containing protein
MEIKKDLACANRGFTLLETLVAVSAIATVGILIAQVFFTTTRSNTKTELMKEVKQNGDYALELMTRMIQNSIAINSACTSAGTVLDTIDIKNADGNSTQFGCFLDNSVTPSVTRIASVSAVSNKRDSLSSTNVTLGGGSCAEVAGIPTLQFVCTSYVDQPPKITIRFRLSQRGTPVDQFELSSISFQSTVSPRN